MKLMLKANHIFGNFLEKVLEKMKGIFGQIYLGNLEDRNYGIISNPLTQIYLSAPSIDFSLPQDQQLNPEFNQAIQGKKEWIAKNISGVNKEIFVPASQKSSFATSKHILIDDMQKNIDAWKAAGGKAILHTSTSNTIEQLQKLGL
jgi:hypothetical protein